VQQTRGAARASGTLVALARPRGFQSGSSHPSVQRSLYCAGRKARKQVTTRARKAAALLKSNPVGVQLAGAGKRGPLSQRERALVQHYTLDLGRSQLEAGAAAGVSQQAVSRLLQSARAASGSGADAAGDGAELLVTPPRAAKKRRCGGRPSLLTPATAESVKQAYKKDPFGGVREVHQALRALNIDVCRSTLYAWLDDLNVHARATNLYAGLDERLIHGILNHAEAMKAGLESGAFTHDNIAYADQTPIYICAGHNTAYGDTVVFGDAGDAKGGKKVGNLWAVVTPKDCIRAWITDIAGDEESAKQFFLSESLPSGWITIFGADGNIFDLAAAHGRQLRGRCRKMVLCLDRLGKSGSSEYCVGGHHAPELRVRALKAGTGLLLLCPKGALVNPIELWNMHVKRLMNAAQPVGAPQDSWGQLVRGPRSKDEALSMLTQAIIDINDARATLRWCYHMRCTGADALRRLEGHAVAQAVRVARAAQPVAPFDVLETALGPRGRMSTQHTYPVSACRVLTYNIYFWRHHRLGLHVGLPLPFARPVDADGSERMCRLCSAQSKAAKERDKNLMCCDDCPGVFHRECLGLAEVPAGAWQCAACARGDIGQLRTWAAPHPKSRAAQAPRKRLRAPDSDDERAGSDDE
jgi:hypothetical protein